MVGLGGALLPPFTVCGSVLQHPAPTVELLVRLRAGRPAGAPLDAALVRLLDAPGGVVRTSEASVLAAQLAPIAWFGRLLAAEGWAMLFVAVIATLVQMRLWVRSLAPEVALRRAVGARRGHVLALILARAALVGLGGVAVGLALGPATWSALGTVLRGLPPWDAGIVLRFAAVLVAATTAAALLPAWRATHAPPAALLARPGA